MRDQCASLFREVQDAICAALSALEGDAPRYREDLWERPGGGGGRTRLYLDGSVLERGGVNFSEVHGELDEQFAPELPGEGRRFYATGISMVLHPMSPRIPSVHCNFRYLEKGDRAWFGGGADLTPYHPAEEDARHFHRTLKAICDRHDPEYYPAFKAQCDEYFYLPHRGEMRGVGGIFFDDLPADAPGSFDFVADCARSWFDAWLPIAEQRQDEVWTDDERRFQQVRRGRYVEFNLLYDRGTRFGLQTGGRVESILMSMPPSVRWVYDHRPGPTTREAEVLAMLQPRDWA